MAANRIRVFRFSETTITDGQNEVNTFLETVSKVHSVTGNIAPQTTRDTSKSLSTGGLIPSDILVIVHYEE